MKRPNSSNPRRGHPTRLLAALELLQTHGRITGAELARRLDVDRRTVRRYVAALEDLGVPVTTERGPAGGYELVAGYRLPPLMLTDEEAVAVSLGLAAVRGYGLLGAAHAVESARAKLERVMPPRARGRLRAVAESVSFAPDPAPRRAEGAALAALGVAVHEQRAVRLAHRAPFGDMLRETVREIDPFGLAFVRGRWYVIAFCHLRKAVRSFRLDRVVDVVPLARPFERPRGFDAMAHLRSSFSRLPRAFSAEVLLKTDLGAATARLIPELGVLEAEGPNTRMRSEVNDLEWFARELARLPWPIEVRRPPALAVALANLARRLLRSARAGAPAARAGRRGRRESRL